jgi:predicted Rossmann fold nucleotide-binding protein DprA/Smf involved in DNA uptake
VETADDILEELQVSREQPRTDAQAGAEVDLDPLLACVPAGEPCGIEAIVERSGVEIGRLLTQLLDLELRGLIRRDGGGRFVRI